MFSTFFFICPFFSFVVLSSTKFFFICGRKTTEDDTVSSENYINSLVEWSTLWRLPLNIEKCKCMHDGRKSTAHSYQMNDHILENVKEEKVLGVIIDNRLKFHTHTSAAKASTILGLIKRSFDTLDEDTLPFLFTYTHLEYGNIIWAGIS